MKTIDLRRNKKSRNRLRQSLSETLTIFYPIAGTVVQNSHVDCDDTGAEFVEARVHAPLSHFTQNPNFEELVKQLFPTADGTETRNLSVKISFFECGGFAVGLFLSHKLVDGSSAAAFVRAWGKTCCGEASGIIHRSRGQTHLRCTKRLRFAMDILDNGWWERGRVQAGLTQPFWAPAAAGGGCRLGLLPLAQALPHLISGKKLRLATKAVSPRGLALLPAFFPVFE
ncbi:vinorine synthase-like [Salvia splendens]|uniref:vinorine synthase-like n=1 Tax=Salvia splendens TaxID=180675 RepID=UPI001C27DA65|nr:vinorine synthase-like [Salvia splendens]